MVENKDKSTTKNAKNTWKKKAFTYYEFNVFIFALFVFHVVNSSWISFEQAMNLWDNLFDRKYRELNS
jgi:hypothetical protein